MSRQLLKQTDGLYAIYSTVVDGLIFYDANADQIIDFVREEAADKAEKDYRERLVKVDQGYVPPMGVTWKEAVRNHLRSGGELEEDTE